MTAADLIARADEIDNRLGPIPGPTADAIAIQLREAAKAWDSLRTENAQLRDALNVATSKSGVATCIGGQTEHDPRPYGEWCRNPAACAGKGYCPLDPTCGD